MRKKEANHGYWAQVATEDGLRLDGFLHSPVQEADANPASDKEAAESPPRPVALIMHGAGANFYGASLINRVGSQLLKSGMSVLRANNRGHDGWHVAFRGGRMVYMGSAFERLEESMWDVCAWVDWLTRNGFGPITLVGHSLGAFKSLFALQTMFEADQHQARWANIDKIVAISPPCLSQSMYEASDHAKVYSDTIANCQKMLDDDQEMCTFWATYPFHMLLSPGCYLNKYVSGERFNFLQWNQRLPKPTYWIFGGAELKSHQVLGQGVEILKTQLPAHHDLTIVDDADHFFTGFTRQVCVDVANWLEGK